MAKRRFQVGQAVHLLTLGPLLTVKGYTENGLVICEWREGKRLYDGEFREEQLRFPPPPRMTQPRLPQI